MYCNVLVELEERVPIFGLIWGPDQEAMILDLATNVYILADPDPRTLLVIPRTITC
jgi:hypothetical protein